MTQRPHLWLVGLPGVGKTSIGRRIARFAGAPFFDTDAEVTRRVHRSIEEFWRVHGEAAFRGVEVESVAAAAALEEPTVIATGGGAVLDPGSRDLMRSSGRVVWLTMDLDRLAARLEEKSRRPVLDGGIRQRLDTLVGERAALYEEVADRIVEAAGARKDDVAADLARWWKADED